MHSYLALAEALSTAEDDRDPFFNDVNDWFFFSLRH
jgi:hypothetical protein